MTTTSLHETRPPESHRPAPPFLGWLAAAGTVPYVGLKLAWLSGSTVGVVDPALLRDTSMTVLNGVTAVLDACVVVLALALTHRWGRRLPAVAVLLPAWVGTGLLLPAAISVVPAAVLAFTDDGTAVGGLAPWVRPMVYGGFAWQAVFLLIAFALYARHRWSWEGRVPGAVRPLGRALVGGGAVLGMLSAVLQLAAGLDAGGAQVLVGTVNCGLAVAGVVGVAALVRGGATGAAVAGWVGTGGMFAWGLYTTALTMGATVMAGQQTPVAGLAALTGLLGGFALAAGGMTALAGGQRGT
jgi:hypothetical protein